MKYSRDSSPSATAALASTPSRRRLSLLSSPFVTTNLCASLHEGLPSPCGFMARWNIFSEADINRKNFPFNSVNDGRSQRHSPLAAIQRERSKCHG